MDVNVVERSWPLRVPLRAAFGEVRERTILELTLRGSDGLEGRGEAAPLEPYDGVPLAAARIALGAYVEILQAAGDEATGAELLDACRAADPLPQALAAVDVALWDWAGRREGRPLAALLAADPLRAVPVNAVVGATDRAAAAAAAARAVADGFACVKLKVGVGDDAGRVAAVRAAIGPQCALRLDANGAWSVEEAIAAIETLAPAGLEIVEEPVHGIAELRAVRERVAVRIGMDETAAIPGAIGSGAADAVCLKVSRAGGISALLVQATLARAAGADVWIASTLEGPLGVAAALHAAAALGVTLPCGLATLSGVEGPGSELLQVVGGHIKVPSGPGLGLP